MADWLLFAEETTGVTGLLTGLLAVVTGSVTIVTTLIKARAEMEKARARSTGRVGGGSEPPAQGISGADVSAPERTNVTPATRSRVLTALLAPATRSRALTALLLACGLMLVGWAGYALFEIHKLDVVIAAKEDQIAKRDNQIADKDNRVADKERQLDLLRQSIPQVSGVTFKSVVVKSEYTSDDNTRLYTFWVEAAPAILEQIANVKYVFDDPSWHGPSVLTETEPNLTCRKHFRCQTHSRQALTYITAIVAYKDYKESGAIQPINFKWRDEARLAE
jgi:hypothetical protein